MPVKLSSVVELRAAKIPGLPGVIADHYWFVIKQDNRQSRWEVWQQKNVGGQSWHYLHKNLKACQSGVGNGPSRVEYVWIEEEADKIIRIIEQSPNNYSYLEHYRYWPGPNSNTYIQWVLDRAKIDVMIGPSAIGKDYLGLIAIKKNKQCFSFSTPIIAVKYAKSACLIIQILTLSFGVRFKPLGIIYPGLRAVCRSNHRQ